MFWEDHHLALEPSWTKLKAKSPDWLAILPLLLTPARRQAAAFLFLFIGIATIFVPEC